jgi:hypothetical protein
VIYLGDSIDRQTVVRIEEERNLLFTTAGEAGWLLTFAGRMSSGFVHIFGSNASGHIYQVSGIILMTYMRILKPG